MTLAGSWRRVLVDDPTNARPIVASLLNGQHVTITPMKNLRKRWTVRGSGSLSGLLHHVIFAGNVSLREYVPKGSCGSTFFSEAQECSYARGVGFGPGPPGHKTR